MTAWLALAAALALPARAQSQVPAVPPLPEAPAASAGPAVSAAQPGVLLTPEQRRQQAADELRRAVFKQPAMLLPSYQEFQRQRDEKSFRPIGHRVVSDEELGRHYRASDGFDDTRLQNTTAQGWTEQTVQLSFARPLPGLEAGVGFTDRHEWMGAYHTPNDRTGFAFLRIPLGQRSDPDEPKLFLPRARVTETTHAGAVNRLTIDDYSIDDLPSNLRP